METLREYFLPVRPPADEQVVFLPRGNHVIQRVAEMCRRSPHRHADMSDVGAGNVGAIVMGHGDLTLVLDELVSSGGVAPRQQVVEIEPQMSKLVICPVPISRDGRTVVNPRVRGSSVFLALPVMETVTPSDFDLVKFQGIKPCMGDLVALGVRRALEEEAGIQASHISTYPIGLVGGGKDLGILVLARTSPLISLEAFAGKVNGYIIPADPTAYVDLARELGGQVDGWTYSTLSLLQADVSVPINKIQTPQTTSIFK